jgi:PEGA domain
MKERVTCMILFVVGLLALGSSEAQQVALTSDPSGSEILVRGVKVGTTPLSVNLDPGLPIEITSRFPRLTPVVLTVTPISGEAVKYKFNHAYGTMVLVTDRSDAVSRVDGELFTRLPLVVFLAPGRHRVDVTAPSAPNKTRQVEIADGEKAHVRINLDRGSPDTERGPATPKPSGTPMRARSTATYALR